jgi:hypothetical protein
MKTQNTRKTIERYTKKRIKELLKMIEEKANENILSALSSGAIADNSEFLEDNHLLAMCLIEDAAQMYKIRTPEYKKESQNIKLFIS